MITTRERLTRLFARVRGCAFGVGGMSLLLTTGCANNPMMQGQVTSLQQQTTQLAQRNQELQDRAAHLDKDNQELETLLAQTRQQSRVLEDQSSALRDQLAGATTQIAKMRGDNEAMARRAESLEQDARQRIIPASASSGAVRSSRVPPITIPGVEIRQDGDVVRVELPAGRMFEPDTARLTPQGTILIDQVGAELMRAYPEQMIGVEGHTDTDALAGQSRWQSNHQLSTARALAVYDQLSGPSRVPPTHLFVGGHGANHPIVSNGTLQGKERNRRVELVVYPDRAPQR
ncbi:MAG: OmpA family protein [Planctomycetes bacterium]|nr:OmpA family protein [Planctomycetota bacterium]